MPLALAIEKDLLADTDDTARGVALGALVAVLPFVDFTGGGREWWVTVWTSCLRDPSVQVQYRAARSARDVIPLGRSHTATKHAALKAVADRFEVEFASHMTNQGLAWMLATKWVRNSDWKKIRAGMLAYQGALENDAAFRSTVISLAATTVD